MRIEPRGFHLLAKRRRWGLPWAENRFVSGPQIRDVYREAEGVRVEFIDNTQRAFLKFWADDSATAASIVELLPTARTVESEDATLASSRSVEGRAPIRVITTVVAVIGVLAASAWFAMSLINRDTFHQSAPASSVTGQPSGQAIVVRTTSPSSEEIRVLQADFRHFTVTSNALQAQFSAAFSALEKGSLSQQEFSNRLERSLIPQWKSQRWKLQQASFAMGSRRARLRALLMNVAINWQRALEAYVEGLRAQDARIVLSAFEFMGKAKHSEREAQASIEQLALR